MGALVLAFAPSIAAIVGYEQGILVSLVWWPVALLAGAVIAYQSAEGH